MNCLNFAFTEIIIVIHCHPPYTTINFTTENFLEIHKIYNQTQTDIATNILHQLGECVCAGADPGF